jgi:hypothetical protein
MESCWPVGENFIDGYLQLFSQDLHVRFLEHARVAAGNVANPDTVCGAPAPAQRGIFVVIDVRLVCALASGRPEQQKLAVKHGRWLISLFGEQVNRPYRDLLKALGC